MMGEPAPHPRFPVAIPPVSATFRICRDQARDMAAGLRASLASAATRVLFRSSAMVSGPTPPGTGVSAPRTVRHAGMHVSDDERPTLREGRAARRPGANSRSTSDGSVTRLVPTSTTVAPG